MIWPPAPPIRPAIAGTVYLVGAGPGDPGLLTLRGAEILSTADAVLHDELVHPALLELVRPDAEVRSVGKRGGDRIVKQAKQEAIEAELVSLARQGKSVARLKGGDPFLFGRGSEEAEALAGAGVPFEVVPGVSAPLAATAYAGISLTHRDLASSVTFVSGTTRHGSTFDWSELRSVRGTLCVLMGMRRLEAICAELASMRGPDEPAAVIQWGTRAEQAVVTGPLGRIAERARAAGLGSPGILVVGKVAELRERLRWFDRWPLFGKRILVSRALERGPSTARQIRARGGEPIELPGIAFEPAPDAERVAKAARELDLYDVVIFTSETGVEFLFRELARTGRDVRAFGRAKVAAIGTTTASALASRGLRADVIAKDFHGEGLAAALLAEPSLAGPGRRALIPRALSARDVVPDALRAAGWEVSVVATYVTVPSASDRSAELAARLEAREIDVVLLTSKSTVESLCDRLEDRATALLGHVLLASIGPVTTAAAEARGLTVAITAPVHTMSGLLEAIERHYATR